MAGLQDCVHFMCVFCLIFNVNVYSLLNVPICVLVDVYTCVCFAAVKVSREKLSVPEQFDNPISSVSCLLVLSPNSSSVLNS